MWIYILLGIGLYFTPTIIAFHRKKRNKNTILALNFFLGITIIGWIVSLIWALTQDGIVVISKKE